MQTYYELIALLWLELLKRAILITILNIIVIFNTVINCVCVCLCMREIFHTHLN
jgi:hypothetical protein